MRNLIRCGGCSVIQGRGILAKTGLCRPSKNRLHTKARLRPSLRRSLMSLTKVWSRIEFLSKESAQNSPWHLLDEQYIEKIVVINTQGAT